MNTFLKPGLLLMRRLSIAQKLILLFVVMLATEVAQMMGLEVFGMTLGLSLVLYLMLSCYHSLKADLLEVVQFVNQTAAGNLRVRIQPRGRDEIATMAASIQAMANSLSAMVASIRSNSALVAYAGQSLAVGNEELSQRTEQQAANLQQTSASVQELFSTVQAAVQTTQAADAEAMHVRDVAEQGAQSMSQVVQSVDGIQGNAKRMNEIIGVIDGLAFQTNILALNAAVEAARAGETGRGFAVVASEVRSLAQRSADSAKEIRQLISASGEHVSLSANQIQLAGQRNKEIVDGIREVASNMSKISSSSAAQSDSLKEVTAAVSQLDQLTQRNAQMVERAVEQSHNLKLRAATLSKSVQTFKLQQGTADEAIGLVEKALAYRKSTSRDQFITNLTAPANGFFDRDMYIFILDEHGKYLAFGGNSAKVGTRVQDIAGINGQSLLDAIAHQAQLEPGWVEYDITNPATGAIQTKMSYVTQVDGMYLGCGVYKDLVLS